MGEFAVEAPGLEMKLLLACARTEVTPDDTVRIREALQRALDWPRVVELGQRHGVMPLLYKSLYAFSDAVPADVLADLQRRFRANALRNLRLTRELIRVLRHLESAGIVAVPYKGPVLAEGIYGDLGMRQFADLDVLVRRSEVARSVGLLADMGYRRSDDAQVHDAAYLQSMHHLALSHAAKHTTLEVHWELAERYFALRLGLDDLWPRLAPCTVAGMQVLGLSPEDALLVLCIHGSKHGWERLTMICDVAETMRSQRDMDWDQVLQRAKALGVARMLRLSALLAERLLNVAAPPAIAADVAQDPELAALSADVEARLFSDAEPTPEGSERARFFQFHMRSRERWQDRLRYGWNLTFTPSQEDWAALPLPRLLYWLHYPLRPLRLLAAFARKRTARNP